jgi:gluconolactonase
MAKALFDIDQFHSFAGGLDHPECVNWGPDGYAYAGGEAGQIYRVSLAGKVEQIASTGGFILGLCLDADCNIYACDVAKNQVVKVTPDGKISIYSEGSPDRKIVSPNYAAFDRHGNLYVTGSGIGGQNNSALFRIKPGGVTEMISDTVCETANGLALSPDESMLYLAMTETGQIVKLALPPDGQGPVGEPQVVATLERTIVDGVAVDAQGNIYVGCYSPDAIYRVTPDGQVDLFAEDWKRNTFASPVNIAWAGKDWKTMLVSNFARWDLVMAEVPFAGRPINYPKIER